MRLWKLKIPRAIQVILATCVLLFLTSIYAHKIEPNWLEVKQINISLPNLDREFVGYRIVQLTDLHVGDGISRAQLERIVDVANAQQPDAIVLTGDYISRKPELQAKLLTSTLAGLHARDRVLAVLGNHDAFDGNSPSVRRSIANSGVTLLENSIYTVNRNGATLHIAGVGDVWYGAANLPLVLAQLPDTGAAIMLAHEPDFADETAATGRFGLQLSGHSHGGQVRIPFMKKKYPHYAVKYPIGQYQVGEMIQYTNRGVGFPAVHARFNCRPEISVFNLVASG
jgi:predicted MPP superfamily phosphohydrolase